MRQLKLVDEVTAALREDPRIRGLFLGGSFGRGTADQYSDVDLIAVVAPDHQAEVAAAWRDVLEAILHIVFWQERRLGGILLNAISGDWLRCDMFISSAETLASRSQDAVRPLFDRDDLFKSLASTLPPRKPDAARIGFLINEFLRVLGLLGVGAGRGEYFLCAGRASAFYAST